MNRISNIYMNNDVSFMSTNQKCCIVKEYSIQKELDVLFPVVDKIYHGRVKIFTKNNEFITNIYSRKEDYLITIYNEKILISDIISIELL